MSSKEIDRYKNRLDNLFDKQNFFAEDLELQAHWARYLCVLVSGYLEIAVKTILTEYAAEKSHPNVTKYVSNQLNRFRSPSMSNIIELSELFSPTWAEELRTSSEGEIMDAVNSIVSIRHQIAHGKDTGISYTQMKRYYSNAVKAIELLEQKCG